MVRKLKISVLGIVENFTGEIFGSGGGEILAKELETPFLGSMTLRSDYRDDSKPTVLNSDEVRKEYENLMTNLETRLISLRKTS
jgi:ATP-binding protein involved in chromosome partitioning